MVAKGWMGHSWFVSIIRGTRIARPRVLGLIFCGPSPVVSGDRFCVHRSLHDDAAEICEKARSYDNSISSMNHVLLTILGMASAQGGWATQFPLEGGWARSGGAREVGRVGD
jgi:hypothetical protein